MTQHRLSCLDDEPDTARKAARQQFFLRWYIVLATVPFFATLAIQLRFFPQSQTPVAIWASLVWAGAALAYTAVVWLGLRCPCCEQRYGGGEKCLNCHLPRHSESSTLHLD